MSFILDALKKAESERNRQLGPVLMDARIASPRRALPAWGWVLAAVLAVNVGLLAWLLLRSPAPPPRAEAAATTQPPAAPASAAATDSAPAAAPLPPPHTAPDATANVQSPPTGTITFTGPVRPGSPSLSSDAEALPTALELQARGVTLPELQLNLHIYDPEPLHRSILLNGQRLREGEFTPDGVRVERITEQSVVLEAAGRRFRIVAGG